MVAALAAATRTAGGSVKPGPYEHVRLRRLDSRTSYLTEASSGSAVRFLRAAIRRSLHRLLSGQPSPSALLGRGVGQAALRSARVAWTLFVEMRCYRRNGERDRSRRRRLRPLRDLARGSPACARRTTPHLRSADAVLAEMPPGLNLKSVARATNIAVPEAGHTFPEWCRARGLEDHEPCSMESFAAYGMGVCGRFAPDLEPVEVTTVTAARYGFDVTLATGERLRARNVVSATGLWGLAEVPEVIASLGSLMNHTSVLPSYARFAGRQVAVIGGGASAIEAAVFIREAGGDPLLLVREDKVLFTTLEARVRPVLDRIREPDALLGSSWENWLIEKVPWGVFVLPEERRVRFVERSGPPKGPWWMRDRFDAITVRLRTQVIACAASRGRVELRLRTRGESDSVVEVDEVVAGTGFALDVDRVGYLAADVCRRVRRNPARTRAFGRLRVVGARPLLHRAARDVRVRPAVPVRRGRAVRGADRGSSPRARSPFGLALSARLRFTTGGSQCARRGCPTGRAG